MRRFIYCLIVVAAALWCTMAPLLADNEEYQSPEMQVTQSQVPQPEIKDYRLGVDDIVSIFVWRHPEFSTGGSLQQGALGTGIQVTTDGYITYPFLGRLYVVGMTLDELKAKILEALKDIYRNPVVTVGIAKRRMFRLYVLSEVFKPGLYDMDKPELTIMEALTVAGGLKEKAAVARATLQRGNEVIPLDLTGLVYRGEAGPPYTIRPEDRLVIPEQRKRIAVIGEVQKQGLYDIRDENTVLDAIALAGGYNDRAKPQNLAILRRINGKTEVIPINTRAIFGNILQKGQEKFKGRMVATEADMQKEALAKNIELQDRDIIYVPQLNAPKWNDIIAGGTFLYYLKLLFPSIGN